MPIAWGTLGTNLAFARFARAVIHLFSPKKTEKSFCLYIESLFLMSHQYK